MTKAESIVMFEELKATFPDAVVSCVVSVDANTEVTTTGLRSDTTIARAISGGGMADNVDFSVLVEAASFSNLPALRGRTMKIGETSYRITATNLHELGGLVLLRCGDWDRVKA